MSTLRSRIKTRHAEKVLLSLDELRAWDWICDFTIQVGSESFSVHRTVLAACSKYFFNLFKRNGEEFKEGGMEIEGLTANTVKLCIEFMYSGVADITLENADHIVFAADHFNLPDLTELCLDFLAKNRSIENCLYIKNLYAKYGYAVKGKDLEDFINDNFEDLATTKSFLTLKKDDVLAYLRSPNVNHKSLWMAITTWVKFQEDERKKHYFEFLSLNSTKFPPEFWLGTIWPDRLTNESKPCKDLMMSVLLSDVENLKNGITLENCFLLKDLCESYHHTNSTEAHNQVRLFMMKNFEKIADREEIVELTKDEIFQIFRSPKTNYSSEVTKWEIATRWTKHDLRLRKKFFPDLLQAIKLENLPVDFIQDEIRPDPLVQELSQCKEILMDALFAQAHARPNKPEASSETPPRKRSAKETTTPKVTALKSPKPTAANPSPSKRPRKAPKTTKKNPVETAPEDVGAMHPEPQVSSSKNFYLAIFNPNSGKIKGLDLETCHWKDLAVTKVTKDEFQGVTSVANKLFLLKGCDLFLLDKRDGWKKLATKPTKPKTGAKMVAFQNFIYIIQNGSLSYYDLDTNKWTETGSFIIPGDGFCICATDMFIYILGGSQNPTKARKYDPLSGAITDIEPLATPRQGAAAAQLNDKVYILGGALDEKLCASAESYDPNDGTWMVVPNMQVQRSNFYACTFGRKIYAVGGAKSSSTDKMDSVEVYDITKGKYKWRLLQRMMKTDSHVTACVVEMPVN